MVIRAWTRRKLLLSFLFVGLIAFAINAQQPRAPETTPNVKPRVVITADPELDDNNSLIRAVLYSTDFKIEGLVYASSQFHWKGDGKGTTQYIAGREYTRIGLCPCTSWRFDPDEHFIDNIVDAYAKVYPNLKIHDLNYPNPAELKSKIKWGNVEFDGDYSQDTDGSNLIKSLLLDNQPGPLYVTAQGGESTIARALKSIHDQYANTPQWDTIRNKVSEKLIILPSGDQDNTYARYIEPNWPEVGVMQFGGMNYSYGVRAGLAPENEVYVSAAWTEKNISSVGPLGALYRVWGDGKQMVKGDRTDYFGMSGYTADQLKAMGYMVWTPPLEKGAFIGEGDDPTFMNLLNNGLRAIENPSYGGWGGRSRPDGPSASGRGGAQIAPAGPDDPGIAPGLMPGGASGASATNTSNAANTSANVVPGRRGAGFPVGGAGRGRGVSPKAAAVTARFFAAAENDFAARLKWSVTPKFSDANHEPHVAIKGPLEVSAKPGSTVRLQGEVSDPDHNAVTVRWWQYNDAGTYPGDISFSAPSALTTTFQVPSDSKPGQTIHVILEGTDDGTPPLTRYQRVIVSVR